MNSSLIKGLVIGGVLATAGGAIAGYNMSGTRAEALPPSPPPPAFAEVINVTPATRLVSVPREVCEDVVLTHEAEPRDEHRIMGTAAGAIVGGLLGNQVGGGNGKKLATVAGAAAGGYAGNRIQQRVQTKDTYTTTETRCETVTDSHEQTIGYDVTYRIGDVTGTVRMDEQPGERVPLANGELALN